MDTSQIKNKCEQYVQKTESMRNTYRLQAFFALLFHFFLQFFILIGAASLPYVLNIPGIDRRIPTVISGAVAICTAIATFTKLGDRARDLNLANAAMRREIQRFDLRGGDYKGLSDEEALSHFAEQIENIREKELKGLVSSSAYKNVSAELVKSEHES